MAQVEPMDVENIGGEFDDKENSLHNSNVLPKTPSTEKGFEELDASELNMKLRFSITPSNSPMSRSYTANCKADSGPNSLNNTVVIDNNLTRSLNTSVNKTDVLKAPKLPLQALPTSLFTNNDRSLSEREGNLTVTITGTENDDNLSLPSTSSSALHTPEATTPTKEIPKSDGSPIMRGLKSVLNMFRSSHNPVPPSEDEDPAKNGSSNTLVIASTPISSSTVEDCLKETSEIIPIHENPHLETPAMDEINPQLATSTSLYQDTTPAKEGQSDLLVASTPISNSKIKDSKNSSKRNSPLKESVVFNEDLERELQWQDETEIFFKYEKIPTHKQLFHTVPINIDSNQTISVQNNDMSKLNTTVEYMDVSNADISYKSVIEDKTLSIIDTKVVNTKASGVESDEFLDCETTYSQNKSYILETAQENKASPVVFQTDIIPHEACLEDCIATTNKSNNINNDEITVDKKSTELIVSSSLETNNLISQKPVDDFILQDNALNFDTDDTNTNRILFKIDELLLNKINLENIKKDIVSNNNETKSEYKKTSENPNVCVSNTSKETLSDESRALNDTVTISNIEETNVDLKKSIEINELSKITEELIENTLVPDGNIDDYNMFSISMKNSMEIKELDPQNMEVDKTSDFKTNTSLNDDPLHSSDKKNISVMQQELNIVDEVKNNISDSRNAHLIVSQLQNIEGSQDVSMDSLEPTLDFNNDHLTREINKTGIHEEVHYNTSEQNYNVITPENNNELIKNPLINEPLPLDVPLPSDDDYENDNLLNLCSIKSDTDMVSKIETEKTACVMVFNSNTEPKEAINCTNLSKPFQSDNDHDPKISHSDSSNCVVEELQINFNSGVEMASAESNLIQNTPFGLLSSNLTSGFQELKVDSNKKESQQMLEKTVENLNDTFTCSELVIKSEINVDTATEISLSNMRAVNNTEKNNLSTQKLKTDITNETVSLDFNMNSKVIDDEIMTSANNSPYVSVTELNLNSDIPVDQSENAPKPITEAVVSPPISPKLTRKGYNIDFDAIENPFATKTYVRMSPPPGIPNKTFTPINNQTNYEAQRRSPDRRRSQPESKKPHTNKKRFNTSLDRVKITNSSKIKKSYNKVVNAVHIEENKIGEDKNVYDVNNLAPSVEDLQKEISPSVKSEDDYSYTSTAVKTSPDLENQKILRKSYENNISTALNLNSNKGTGSVFNITEFDDLNFNPFASKSRMCVTPPPTEVIDPLNSRNDIEVLTDFVNENQFKTEQVNATVCIDNNVQDRINITEQENATVCREDRVQNEEKASINTSNTTYTSINTEDKDITVREVNTEDEDTIEGPFFEAEDLLDVVKVPEIEIEKETMQFEDLPTTSNNEHLDKGELFIDAEAFEFLLNQNHSNVVADSGKESLFLKFDPLFAKRVSSDGVLAALSSIAKKQSTPKKLTKTPLVNLARAETPTMPVPGPSDVASMPEVNNEEIVTVAKPMMVVNPAVTKQPVATPRISLTPKTKRQSLNFASPAMVVIDRLLSLSGNTSLLDHDDTTDANRNREANIVLVQLRELLAEKELHVYGLKCESNQLRERLTTLESQVKSLENEGEERLRKVNMLNERLVEKTKINKSMAVVVEEYERTIASLIAQIEQEKKQNAEEKMKLINERDEQTAHLASMEGSFSDLHSKYEKCKQIILSMKANEDGYKKSFKQFDENLLKMQKNYDLLKQHATSKLNHANQELEKMNRAHEAEVIKLTAMIKRKDLHISSLEETLAQKKKAIEELTAICDELINKVG